MDQPFSLEYYDKIFGRRSPEFWALVAALEDELESYARELPNAVASRDREALSRLRHSHRPAIVNLRLGQLRSLEAELLAAFEAGLPSGTLDALALRLAGEIHNVTRGLAEGRRQAL